MLGCLEIFRRQAYQLVGASRLQATQNDGGDLVELPRTELSDAAPFSKGTRAER